MAACRAGCVPQAGRGVGQLEGSTVPTVPPCPAGLRRWVGAMVPKLWTPHSQGWTGDKRPAGRAGSPPSPSRRAWPVVTFGGRQAEDPELCRLPRPAALTLHALVLLRTRICPTRLQQWAHSCSRAGSYSGWRDWARLEAWFGAFGALLPVQSFVAFGALLSV